MTSRDKDFSQTTRIGGLVSVKDLIPKLLEIYEKNAQEREKQLRNHKDNSENTKSEKTQQQLFRH